jgi:two-component system, chemotaxis family, protein-glutamate methylesterase/glutaminase
MVDQAADKPSTASPDRAPHREIAVVGASAGGVEALTALVRGLPVDSRLAVLVVLHMPVGASSRLPEILSRAGPLPARAAVSGALPRPGYIHVAPPDRHLVLSGGRMVLMDGPRENGFRPAIDPLFRSAARSAGTRAIGVILSGTMDDGVAGLAAIKALGGTTIVQDPADAMCGALPEAALEAVTPDHVLAASAIGPLLGELGHSPAPTLPRLLDAASQDLAADPMTLDATGVDLSCPECGGALQEVAVGSLRRYRCRVGHVLSPESLLNGQGIALESALWAAVRTLEETATVSRRLAERSRQSGAEAAARRFEARQVDAAQRADVVRQAIGAFEETLNEPTEDALAADAN